jgi:hypothetical protein
MSTRVRARLVGAASLAGVVVLAAACGGGGGSGPTNAAGAETTITTTTAITTGASGQANTDYLQCLRDHGISVPSTPPSSGSGTPPSSTDRSVFQQARQACGAPPDGFGGFGGGGAGAPADPQATQQAALQLAACLREQGLNVADPDFSTTTTTPPTSATGTSGAGGGGFRGGGAVGAILRNLDRNDPTVQAALQQCQADLPGRGRAGPGASTTMPPTTG